MSMKNGLLDVSMLLGSSVETKQACRLSLAGAATSIIFVTCRDKSILAATKLSVSRLIRVCCDKTLVATSILLS